MLVGLYTAASELDVMGQTQDVIARNLANANTAGYKRGLVTFETVLTRTNAGTENASVSTTIVPTTSVDYTPGSLVQTGNDFDLAIKGDGFFTIQTDKGIRYTRRGRFLLSPNKEIITPSGGRLLGGGGTIQVPPKTRKISVDASGMISANGRRIGELEITHFPNPNKSLTQCGVSTFKSNNSLDTGEKAEDFEVAQGYIEKSNVDVIGEMVSMITNMRSYGMGHRVTKSMSESLDGLIRLAG